MKSIKTHLKTLISILIFLQLLSTCTVKNSDFTHNITDKKYTLDELRENFADPPMFYAPHMFWFWNDSLNAGKSRQMAASMIEKNMNPGYIHPRHGGSRQGLPVSQWLTDEYFHAVDLTLQEAEKAGMYMGFSDEYWWPSGRIGGKMIQEHPELQSVSLNCEIWNRPGPWEVILPPNEFVVAAEINNEGLIITGSLQSVSNGERKMWNVPPGNWRLYIYSKIPGRRYSRGPDFALPNYMDPRLAPLTIEKALEPYEDYFGERLGKSLRVCFADNEGDWGTKIAWSDYFPERYIELKGKDPVVTLPLLFDRDDGGTWVTARCDYHDVVSDLYFNGFWKPMNDWLASRNMLFISNFWEHSLLRQVERVGDFFMAQRTFSLPGNDCLDLNAFNVLHFKETQSVCEFEGRGFMSEIMGVRGWGQTPAEMKQAANAITAWGVTHVVPHGTHFYRNLEKAQYPPDWFDSNPWWENIDLWNDFVRRASFVNRQASLSAEILLYHPLETVRALSSYYFAGEDYNKKTLEARAYLSILNNDYHDLQQFLSDELLDYLIADRYYLKKADLIEGPFLQISGQNFSAIVLTSQLVMEEEALDKVIAFAEAGGRVICLGKLPSGSSEEGMNDLSVKEKTHHLENLPGFTDLSDEENKLQALKDVLITSVKPHIKILEGDGPTHFAHKTNTGAHFYWLANNSGNHRSMRIILRDGAGQAEKWNCETGEISSIYYQVSDEGNELILDLDAYEGCWIVFDGKGEKIKSPASGVETEIRELNVQWSVYFPDDDNLPAMGRPEPLPGPVITDQLETWEELGYPWYSGFMDYKADFFIDNPAKNVVLDLGEVNYMAEVWINGQPAGARLWPPFTYDISGHLKSGHNLLNVRVGNLLLNHMWNLDQEDNPNGWGRSGKPDEIVLRSGLFGPVRLHTNNQ